MMLRLHLAVYICMYQVLFPALNNNKCLFNQLLSFDACVTDEKSFNTGSDNQHKSNQHRILLFHGI